MTPLRVGVLLPSSHMFPGVDRRLLAGLRGGLPSEGVELVVEPVGAAAQQDTMSERVRSLLLEKGCGAIVAVAGANVTEHLVPIMEDHRVPLIVCDLGGDLPATRATAGPFIFWNSLNLWQSMMALGVWAAREVGGSVAASVGFHEAGYGLLRAFDLGFRGTGGAVTRVEVTHREHATEDPSAALSRLAESGGDFCMALYSGREGVSFMNTFTALGMGASLPLLTSPLMLHGHWLPQMGESALGIRTACSWLPGGHPEAESRFRAATGADDEPGPDVFGLLGYESGLLLGEALARAGSGAKGAALTDALRGVTVPSPRGELSLDPDTGSVRTRDFLVTVVRGEDGVPVWSGGEALPLPPDYAEAERIVRGEEFRPGWLNPYLVN